MKIRFFFGILRQSSQKPYAKTSNIGYVAYMPLPPSLTPEQRAAALEKAAQARKARAELKEKLKMGQITLASLLERASTDELVGKMKVISVLESLPGIGKVKARKLMDEIGVAETRRLQGLGSNQKERLIQETSKS
ncbi:hypothetical protein SAMN02745225_00527 [Ferrithrix thermotolerans DSM 19514]|uniref:Integration host factor-like helix-two turn-helix domain-containing protein n=2 Tax=Ferrithrix TaxID=643949 RepID=A0A1M4T768_9ACTN|nr:integration host factor, actinobacterial type [Ferrithrix thermotolerans]SHE40188.1 hypothetical protein SAMN02745225_00527 [Ferrithrix thermotolerans DSM 19514]